MLACREAQVPKGKSSTCLRLQVFMHLDKFHLGILVLPASTRGLHNEMLKYTY